MYQYHQWRIDDHKVRSFRLKADRDVIRIYFSVYYEGDSNNISNISKSRAIYSKSYYIILYYYDTQYNNYP